MEANVTIPLTGQIDSARIQAPDVPRIDLQAGLVDALEKVLEKYQGRQGEVAKARP
jgi:hypothetical protein